MNTARKLFQSSGLLIGIRLFQRSLGLISTLILARLLTPADFGIVAVAALIIHFSEVLSNTGIQQYLVQSDQATDEVVNTAWTLDILLKVSLCVLLYLLLPGINWFYDDPNIMYAVGILIPVIAIRALMNPELHVQRRDLNYRIIFKIGVIQKLISFAVVVVIAFQTRSFWAIIIGDLVSSCVGVALSYFYCARHPKLSLRNVSKQWMFSKWMLARGSIGYLRAQMDTLLISQFYSLAQLGKFNIAREFTIMPANEVIQPAVEPLLATFSSVRSDHSRLAKQFSLALLLISIFTSPFVAFIYQFHETIVFYLLGKQWMDAAPLMRAMTPLLFAFALGGILNNLCFSLSKVKTVFLYDLISLALISIILIGVREFSLESFVWVRSFIGLFTVIIFLFVCSRLISANFLNQIFLLITPLIISFPIAELADTFCFDGTLLTLIISGLVSIVLYSILMFFLARFLSARSYVWECVYEYSIGFKNRITEKFLRNQ